LGQIDGAVLDDFLTKRNDRGQFLEGLSNDTEHGNAGGFGRGFVGPGNGYAGRQGRDRARITRPGKRQVEKFPARHAIHRFGDPQNFGLQFGRDQITTFRGVRGRCGYGLAHLFQGGGVLTHQRLEEFLSFPARSFLFVRLVAGFQELGALLFHAGHKLADESFRDLLRLGFDRAVLDGFLDQCD